jgi:hypothetical protein
LRSPLDDYWWVGDDSSLRRQTYTFWLRIWNAFHPAEWKPIDKLLDELTALILYMRHPLQAWEEQDNLAKGLSNRARYRLGFHQLLVELDRLAGDLIGSEQRRGLSPVNALLLRDITVAYPIELQWSQSQRIQSRLAMLAAELARVVVGDPLLSQHGPCEGRQPPDGDPLDDASLILLLRQIVIDYDARVSGVLSNLLTAPSAPQIDPQREARLHEITALLYQVVVGHLSPAEQARYDLLFADSPDGNPRRAAIARLEQFLAEHRARMSDTGEA